MERRYAIPENISGKEIKRMRMRLQMTQADFARFVNVSKKTVERWEASKNTITGPVVTLLKVLDENPELEEALQIPEKKYPLRLWYWTENSLCAVIDVDERYRKIKVYNYTNDLMRRPFGRITQPTFEQYEEFLESRCFPRSRDKMKLMLKELDLPFYDPMMIIEKTQGKMAEDNFWIEIER